MQLGTGLSHLNPVVNTKGALNTNTKSRKLTACRYWNGILVDTTRSMCLCASRHASRSWYMSNAPRSQTFPKRLCRSTILCMRHTTTLARFSGSTRANASRSPSSKSVDSDGAP